MPRANLYYEERSPAPLEMVWLEFRSKPLAMAALYMLLFITVLTVIGPLLTPYGANEQFIDAISLPPAWSESGNIRFLLGTDELGRDMVTRLIYGARYSFGLPVLVVLIAATIGIVLGAAAAMTVGVKSSTLKHLLDVLMSIPSLLLALIIVAILGPGLGNALFAIGLVLIPQFLHVTRNAIHDEQKRAYVTASKLNGVSKFYLLSHVIFPNIIKILVVQFTIGLSVAILDIAALGFLRLGAQAPTPEWGSMLAQSLEVAYVSPWIMALPGLALFLTLVSVNLVGETLRVAINRQLER
ncbi:ABC transporter permease subunit [Aliidiomarina halalkaliphila]|uniref:ABC transporter permease subunit n=1 Tax=Aliidiomarina halalkaliphila TaxID=2593535 RepID=A0A552X3U8_9GAMM|nr:ABC transporter permease subunit [Aliidiomarina halalkaliphila]TRW49655.1 ABC transporter permease subunit [Aliidiomarina halalkaliphila]